VLEQDDILPGGIKRFNFEQPDNAVIAWLEIARPTSLRSLPLSIPIHRRQISIRQFQP